MTFSDLGYGESREGEGEGQGEGVREGVGIGWRGGRSNRGSPSLVYQSHLVHVNPSHRCRHRQRHVLTSMRVRAGVSLSVALAAKGISKCRESRNGQFLKT